MRSEVAPVWLRLIGARCQQLTPCNSTPPCPTTLTWAQHNWFSDCNLIGSLREAAPTSVAQTVIGNCPRTTQKKHSLPTKAKTTCRAKPLIGGFALSSHLALMKIQVKTLFVHDENGKMTFINDPTEPEIYPAPRFFLGFTESGFVFRFRYDLPPQLCAQIKEVIHSNPPSWKFQTAPTCATEIERILDSHGKIERIWCGPAFCFPDHVPVSPEIMHVEKQKTDVFKSTFPDMISEFDYTQPCVAFLDGAKAVSVCQSVRKTPKAEEAGVDTLDGYRGRGYAPLVVAGWAEAVKAKRKIPFYSTSWENRSSQRVAEKLGLIQFSVYYHIT